MSQYIFSEVHDRLTVEVVRVVVAAENHGFMLSATTPVSTAKTAFEPDQFRLTYLLEAALPVVKRFKLNLIDNPLSSAGR